MPTITLKDDAHLQNFKLEFFVTCASGTGEAQCNFHATGHPKSARKRVLLTRKSRCRHTSAVIFNILNLILLIIYSLHLFTLYWVSTCEPNWALHVNPASSRDRGRQIVSPFASRFAVLQGNLVYSI